MKKKNWFLRLVMVLFGIFLALFIASESGYYEAKLAGKVALTDEAIKQFEQDVLDGKNVDINTYIIEDDVDYSNGFTDAGEKLSDAIAKFIDDGLGGTWDAIKVLFFS